MKLHSFILAASGFLLLSALIACHRPTTPASTPTTVNSTVQTTLMSQTTTSTVGTSPLDPSTTPTVTTVVTIPGTTSTPSVTTTTVPVTTTTVPVTTTTVPVTTTTVPVTTTTAPPPVTKPEVINNPWVISCENFVYLRKIPSSNGKKLEKIPADSTVDLLGFSGYYAKVRWKGKIGFVPVSRIVRAEGYQAADELSIVKPIDNYSYEQMQADLRALADAYPTLFTLSSIGQSEEGRDLTLCILGNPDAEKRIFMQASIHGREHVVTLLALCEIDYLLSHQDEMTKYGLTIGELLSKVAIHIVPMSNPDGVVISQTGILPERFREQYANRPGIALYWKANANGIDLNANFDANWDLYESIYQSTIPAYAGYKGESPECAAESIALANYLRAHRFDLTLSYHSTGSLIYWSYDYANHVTVNDQCLDAALFLSDFSGFILGEQVSNSTAGLKDYAIQSMQTPSLTLEFGLSDAPTPFAEFEQIWARGKYTLLTCSAWILQ